MTSPASRALKTLEGRSSGRLVALNPALALSGTDEILLLGIPIDQRVDAVIGADRTRSFGRLEQGGDRTRFRTLGAISADEFQRWSALALTLVCAVMRPA